MEVGVVKMANPLYDSQMAFVQNNMQNSGMQFANPMQKMQYIMQAMRNPAAFVKQNLPDIPDAISNNPNQILQYLQQTRGITNSQIQNLASQVPPWAR